MSLAANIEDKLTILDTEFLVIGIAKLLFKNDDKDDIRCLYTLKKQKDNSIFYLEDRLTDKTYCIYYKTDTKYKYNDNKIIIREYYVLDTVGDSVYKKDEIINCKYKESNQDSILYKNNCKYNGLFIETISVEKRNYNDPFESSLPEISKFHDDNKIKNEINYDATTFSVGDGLLINDNEYFVLSKSDVYSFNIQTDEYKLFNNNDKQYYWIKWINDKRVLFHNDKKRNYIKYNKSGYKTRISLNADWSTTNNTNCYYQTSFINYKIYLKETWQNETLYFEGDELKKFSCLKYNYKINNKYDTIKLKNSKNISIINKKRRTFKLSKFSKVFAGLSMPIVFFPLMIIVICFSEQITNSTLQSYVQLIAFLLPIIGPVLIYFLIRKLSNKFEERSNNKLETIRDFIKNQITK
ncbi:MAG: hypothetical protein MJ211_11315 [Bacteroidales bacterium]|nr:hypothetical protein [Bacteroidales bacterium]